MNYNNIVDSLKLPKDIPVVFLDKMGDVPRHFITEVWQRMSLRRWFLASCTTTLVSSFFTPVFLGTVEKTFGGQMQFLTIIALFLTSVTLYLNQFTKYTNFTYDLLVLSTVVETIVTVYYWTLFHYNRGLLYPPNMDAIPIFIDVFLHFLPAVALWMELLTTIKLHRVSRKHIYTIALFSMGYMAWAEYCFSKNGYYVYPVLSMLDAKGKMFLTIATAFVGIIIYVISVQIHTIYGNISLAIKKIRGSQESRRKRDGSLVEKKCIPVLTRTKSV